MAELIAAVATGMAPSGVGIIRLSGTGAAATAAQVFSPQSGRSFSEVPDRQMIYGSMRDATGKIIDHGLAFLSRVPHSYTGEETVELHCHGSPMVLSLVLEALFALGARQAEAGEFTRRAFLNGKLDLAQAEAVIDLIDAETPGAARQAAGQLGGALSRRVQQIYEDLVDVTAHFHAVLDYPDEEIDPFRTETISHALAVGITQVEDLLATYHRGKYLVRGIPCAIVGQPNVGKSTLLNALVGYERAIVTEIPGTTRDTVEERGILGGILLRLVDTAGLRETQDVVEQLGVARSRAAMEQADVIFVVLDGTQAYGEQEQALLQEAIGLAPTIVIYNKSDLTTRPCPDLGIPVVEISAKEGSGLEELSRAVAALFPQGEGPEAGTMLTNLRQAEAVGRAGEALRRANDNLQQGFPPDLLLSDVEEALSALGELTGHTLREDITARIFSRFCVGK